MSQILAPLDNKIVKNTLTRDPLTTIWQNKQFICGDLSCNDLKISNNLDVIGDIDCFNVDCNEITLNSMKFGNLGDIIDDYQSFTHTIGFTGCGNPFTATLQFCKIGDLVTMNIHPILTPIPINSNGTWTSTTTIPTSVRPGHDICSIQCARIASPAPFDEAISIVVDTDGFIEIQNTRPQSQILRIEVDFTAGDTVAFPFAPTLSWLTS